MAHETLGFHSLTDEIAEELPVSGTVPDWLSGSLVRNGPGAFEFGDVGVEHWFDGLAMLHKFTFEDGGVTYRNRFLHTEAYESARNGAVKSGFATGTTTLFERIKGFLLDAPYDNVNIIAERIGRRYLALTETPRRVEFDPETLATKNHVQYDGPEPAGNFACAHLNRDPETGEMVNFEIEFGRTSKYHVHSMPSARERDHICSISVSEPAYMHSFALTPNYVVLTEFPFVVNPLDLFRPGKQGPFIDQFEWKPERGTRFFVIDRASGEVVAEPRTEAFFGFHHVNAYESDSRADSPGEELVIDLETVPDTAAIDTLTLDRLRAGELGAFAGQLERFRVTLGDGVEIERELLCDGTSLPTVSPAKWCRNHRYVYAQGTDQPVTEWPRELVKIDTETGAVTSFSDGENRFSEPIFVPKDDWSRKSETGDGRNEDEGVVLSVMLDVSAETSFLVVVDGKSFTELAKARVPHAIPFDFHGRFFSELD
ncbi:beta-carotene 15,15'-monooxygenase [Haladaptatus litoreus]|uniref:Beta-carotene 15,15'-monooxygenase n=1 Tax=Haladaptatus litoreus TaxID=553468 RepID=A0A1N7E4L3_9EURY|nr:carotenoid oxygenase family protein [Haladaptatus litoreus]SIR83047.1 beta-carotene 15,15'-monooxygenase [Haladaptatus litoreus]